MAPAAGCKEKVQAQAEKAQAAAPIQTPAEEFRPIPAPEAREPAPAAHPRCPAYPCRAAPPLSRSPVSDRPAATRHRPAPAVLPPALTKDLESPSKRPLAPAAYSPTTAF